MAIGLWIILIIVGVAVLYVIFKFNRLITLRNRIDNAWSQIDVQLKRRADLIPNLVNTVKGAKNFEQETLTQITEARSRWQTANTPQEQVAAANNLESTLARLLVVVENYPQLKMCVKRV